MANLTDAQIRCVFDLFDADGSGFVDADEMGLALQALGFGALTAEEVDAVVAEAVTDGNTRIEYSDFSKVVKGRMATRHSPEEVAKAFHLFDKAGKGKLDVADFLAASRDFGETLPAAVDGGKSEQAMTKLYTEVVAEANTSFPNPDAPATATVSYQQWKLMMRTAVVDKHHKLDDTAFSLKTHAKIAKKGPYGVKVEAGKTYYWCSCGMSKNQPFCDGSHAAFNREHGVEYAPHKYVADEARTVWFCGCKRTKAPPFCDGSHTAL